MTITVQLFAKLRDVAATSALTVEVPEPATVAQLRSALVDKIPDLEPLLTRCRVALNHDFVDDSHTLNATDEVAIIPPVSGG